MNPLRKRMIAVALLLLLFSVPIIATANSMEPPGLVLIIPGHHDNLEIYLDYGDVTTKGHEKIWPFETQYWFDYSDGYQRNEEVTAHADWQGGSAEINMSDKFFNQYHNTYTWDIEKNILTEGKTLIRSIMLISVRVILTLLIEGAMFYSFFYRNKRSWLIFIAVNLLTQTALNGVINTLDVSASYPIIMLVFGEFWVFLVEMIAFPLLLKEHGRVRAVGYAFVANAASLFLGGWLLTWLPV